MERELLLEILQIILDEEAVILCDNCFYLNDANNDIDLLEASIETLRRIVYIYSGGAVAEVVLYANTSDITKQLLALLQYVTDDNSIAIATEHMSYCEKLKYIIKLF